MAELKERIRTDLTEAMKSQDKLRTATLRMLLGRDVSLRKSMRKSLEKVDQLPPGATPVDSTVLSPSCCL
jgi:uncharacterized protein YqeY